MKKIIQSQVALLAVLLVSSVLGFAQSAASAVGKTTYVAKCQGCHGSTGQADVLVGKVMKVKPITDPEVKKLTVAQMIDITRNGKNKMQAFKDKLTDEQIKESVDYFRTFLK